MFDEPDLFRGVTGCNLFGAALHMSERVFIIDTPLAHPPFYRLMIFTKKMKGGCFVARLHDFLTMISDDP